MRAIAWQCVLLAGLASVARAQGPPEAPPQGASNLETALTVLVLFSAAFSVVGALLGVAAVLGAALRCPACRNTRLEQPARAGPKQRRALACARCGTGTRRLTRRPDRALLFLVTVAFGCLGLVELVRLHPDLRGRFPVPAGLWPGYVVVGAVILFVEHRHLVWRCSGCGTRLPPATEAPADADTCELVSTCACGQRAAVPCRVLTWTGKPYRKRR